MEGNGVAMRIVATKQVGHSVAFSAIVRTAHRLEDGLHQKWVEPSTVPFLQISSRRITSR
jgi:hypothetical protein